MSDTLQVGGIALFDLEDEKDMDNLKRIEIVKDIIKEAAQIGLHYFGKVSGSSKSDGTFVTKADGELEAFLVKELQKYFPQDSILGEESGLHENTSPLTWSIDPIDGTSAYLCRLPFWGTSIGLLEDGKPVLGVVYLPAAEELYYASKGQGAYMESKFWGKERLDITDVDLAQKENLIMISSSFHRQHSINYSGKIRNLGSTVANALMVARGDAAGAFMRVHNWDLAACVPILEEAGGYANFLDGSNFDINQLYKGNPNLPTTVLSNPKAKEILLSGTISYRVPTA
ncbi:inositol monophosphatase [bacterium]|nr:inositol monophosphatase [bacterium]